MRRRLVPMGVALATVGGLMAAGVSTASRPPGPAHVVVEDIAIPVPGQEPVQAYLVRPAGELKKNSAPGVLWLHWLGEINNDRSEYLPEAITLAGEGVVSVLPLGFFPWVPNPDGTTGDVTLVENQVAAFGSALDRLAGVRAVDESRIALVGHDYGAMYGAILADSDQRISSMVLQAPDALMGNWFAQFWLGLEGAERDAYLALFDGLDPVDHTARLGDRVLFQWAGEDVFIGQDVRGAYAASSPDAEVLFYENQDHELRDTARVDRLAFLRDQLGLQPIAGRAGRPATAERVETPEAGHWVSTPAR